MKSVIKKIDFLSHKATLTFNRKGETGYKTFIGGLISIICLFFSFICSFYFLYRMFSRKDASVIHSTNINPYVNLTYSHKLPFILRLTDTNSLPFEDDERKYYITASIWQGGTNDTSLSANAEQKSVSLNIGKCDINKHFSEEYKKYFEDFKDLNTYYCIEPRNSSQTIYGIYGNIYPFSYYSFTVRYCRNTTENNNFCQPAEEIQSTFNDLGLFLDVIFIDYTFNALKKKNIKELFIRKDRYELSTVLFKRIWLYLENIKYIIDNGYIFSNKDIEDFHSYESVSSDFSIFERKIVISTLTILNGMKTSIYNKQYTKFQDYLAIMGGLIKAITLFCTILNYFNSQNSYYLKLIKDFIIDNKNINITSKSKINVNQLNSSIFNKSKNISSSLDIFDKKEIGLTPIQKINNNNPIQLIKSSISIKFLPSIFINKESKKILLIYKEFINNRLNIINILKKLEMIQINSEVLKKSIQEISNNNLMKQGNSKINNYIYDAK